MKYILKIDSRLKDALWRHLVPDDGTIEQAAFLYVAHSQVGDDLMFEVLTHELLARQISRRSIRTTWSSQTMPACASSSARMH